MKSGVCRVCWRHAFCIVSNRDGAALPLAAFVLAPPPACSQAAASPSGAAAPVAASEPHFPTTEDLRHVKTMGAPELSPDGRLVLFAVAENYRRWRRKIHLWLAPVAGAGKGAADSPSLTRGKGWRACGALGLGRKCDLFSGEARRADAALPAGHARRRRRAIRP